MQIKNVKDNFIIGDIKQQKSKIVFDGVGNVLCVLGDKAVLKNANIQFRGNNSVIVLGENKYGIRASIIVYNDNILYVGKNNNFNQYRECPRLFCTECGNIFIGDDCLISSGTEIMTSDAHLIYNCEDKKRINKPKSIFIGDHVWLCRSATILKGSKIGSGSIIGAQAVLSGKSVPSNSIFAGNPAKLIKSGVFFDKAVSYAYDAEKTEQSLILDTDKFIFAKDERTIDFAEYEQAVLKLSTAKERAEYLLGLPKDKNRFAQ